MKLTMFFVAMTVVSSGSVMAQETAADSGDETAELAKKSRKAMLQLPDGTTKTITVRKDVDLSQRKIGDEVVFRYTESQAIMVEKP